MANLRRLALPLVIGFLCVWVMIRLTSSAAPTMTPLSVNSGQHFMSPYKNPRDRFGFDSGPLSGYDVAQLHAGWYSNWGANLSPAHPDRLVYVQLIRFHAGTDPHDPDQVTVRPDKVTIARIAATHPGSLWLMSNEPDSLYQGDPILPDVYAAVYHDFYEYITGLDPTALIANGGIVQPTPCRLEYLDIVWDTYREAFGAPMPVHVWNIHAFILREVYGSWGASTPPGVDPKCGIDYAINDADNLDILFDNIRAMRVWMKEKGYQDRPLVITEYGILWPQWFASQFTPARVSHFMTRTFDMFLQTADLEVGYPADDYRLVQAWAWYSLSDDRQYNGYLFHSDTKALSLMGETYGAYTAALGDTPFADLSARLVGARSDFASDVANATPVTRTFSFTGVIGNLGKQPVTEALVRFERLADEGGAPVIRHEAVYSVPARFDGVIALTPLTAALPLPGHHIMRLSLDPENRIVESRDWNNTALVTLDLRPDLAVGGLSYRPRGSVLEGGGLVVTTTVENMGDWPSPAVSATTTLRGWPEGRQIETKTLSIPPLAIGAQANQAVHLTWPVPSSDLYQLVFDLDPDGYVSEQEEGNNRDELLIPISLNATLSPAATTVLTSASGAVQMIFPTGAVRVPTAIRYTPLWPANWETGVLKKSSIAFSLTAVRDDQAVSLTFARPVTVTWRYTEAGVLSHDEAFIRLFVSEGGGVWTDAACRPYQRGLHQNWLTTALCRTGRFLFGNRYDLHLPLMSRQAPLRRLHREPSLSTSENELRRSPLLLPWP